MKYFKNIPILFMVVLCVVSTGGALSFAVDSTVPPVTYHLSYDTMDFVKDDIATRYQEPTIEQRNLVLVDGVFGKALFNNNDFSREDLEKTSMSTWDLDPLLEVLVHHRFIHWRDYKIGRMQPYVWGTGKIKGESGCIAFWAKGERRFPGHLFFLGSTSFGRFEQYLMAIDLNEDGSLTAYVRDARYRYHSITTKPAVWNASKFNHVALAWDRSQGLVLYLNGAAVASNWGTDAWWATQMPGLFHFPISGSVIDEFWSFDRALDAREIKKLMTDNMPPKDKSIPGAPDKNGIARLAKAFIGGGVNALPVVRPFDGSLTTVVTEVYPEWAGDGCSEAPFVLDGKYELAWPQDYTSFTNILGDSDFHPEKVDVKLPKGRAVNYITVEGNLADVSLLAGNSDGSRMKELFEVPEDQGLFYGAAVRPVAAEMYRIPFLKAYGSPPGYKPGLNLALTGDVRIHELGFYSIAGEKISDAPASARRLSIASDGAVPDDKRTGYAMRAVNDLRNSRVLALTEQPSRSGGWVRTGAFSRVNLLSGEWGKSETCTAVTVDLSLRKVQNGDFAILRLHDPGLLARIWNTIVVRLEGFDKGVGRLRLKLDCTDIKLAQNDRIWLDLTFSGETEIRTGGTASVVEVETSALAASDGRYAVKALKPARSDFTKLYYWYYPWRAMNQRPTADAPETFGGFYDIVSAPLLVKRTEPDNFLANTLIDLSLITYPDSIYNSPLKSRDNNPALWPPAKSSPADNSPEWAFYMHYYLSRYKEIVDWWAERQNYDGQVGGGWNDDVLFASRLTGVFLYSGDEKARGIFNKIFEGLERTRMFHDGYCNIDPMDFIHVEDLVRNRYEGLLFEPGDPKKMAISMRTAWHYEKPDSTPVNYIDGKSFKYDLDLINWYWGNTPSYPAYSTTRDKVTAKMKEIAPAMDEVIRFRYTEAGMFTDGSFMPGCYDVKRIQVGGNWGPWTENITLAASWEEGGEPDIPKWIENATDASLTAHVYSYAPIEKTVAVRLYRIVKGTYRITLSGEGKDAGSGIFVDRTATLGRFSIVSVPVRPGRELKLSIELIERLPDSREKPDLAVIDTTKEGHPVSAVVYNFGNAPAERVIVRALDESGQIITETTVQSLPSAGDFVPGTAAVTFPEDAVGNAALIVVDPDNTVEEILEDNNSARVK